MSNYCDCNDFEKAVDYNDIGYYRIDDRFNAVKKAGGMSDHRLMMTILLVLNYSGVVHSVLRNQKPK